MCLNDEIVATYSPEDSKIILRDIGTLAVLGEIDNTVGVLAPRSQYNMSKRFKF